jgi:IS30 family transposase
MGEYKHLNLEEREILFAGRESGKSFREIGERLGRDHSTLSREWRRNAKYGKPYIPCKAHAKAEKRGKEQREKAPLKEPLIFLYVREHLRMGWSPEQISGRLPIDHPSKHICTESIYQYVYHPRNKEEKLWQYLPSKKKKRIKKNGRSIKRKGKIPNAQSIDKRPRSVNKRRKVGHWETDNMEGKKSDESVVSVNTERVSRYTLIDKLTDRGAAPKTDTIKDRLLDFPKPARRSLTADNGKENTNHEEITDYLSMPVYFCHAYHSWEKGTVENTIKRIRRYIPKGESIDPIPGKEIKMIEDKMNHTPRKCLQFLTPYEKMQELLHQEMVKSFS